VHQIILLQQAEVLGATRVNLQPAEHLLFCNQFSKKSVLQLLEFQAQGSEGAGVKTVPKPSLDRWGFASKILSRSILGFGFPLSLSAYEHPYRQTSICPFVCRERYFKAIAITKLF